MAIEYDKIFAWLPKVEGKLTCKGYVPCNVRNSDSTANYRGAGDPARYVAMGVSGVTIGVGVDLGQQTAGELLRWGVSQELLRKLEPYIGLKCSAALKALHKAPLELSEQEARALTSAEHRGYMDDVVQPVWDRSYGSRGHYENLPWQAQCVIFSCIYQCGWNGFRKRGQHTLAALEAHDWPRAVRNLKSGAKGWDGQYWQRRYEEGHLLEELCR